MRERERKCGRMLVEGVIFTLEASRTFLPTGGFAFALSPASRVPMLLPPQAAIFLASSRRILMSFNV
jgi:hypothetical protein